MVLVPMLVVNGDILSVLVYHMLSYLQHNNCWNTRGDGLPLCVCLILEPDQYIVRQRVLIIVVFIHFVIDKQLVKVIFKQYDVLENFSDAFQIIIYAFINLPYSNNSSMLAIRSSSMKIRCIINEFSNSIFASQDINSQQTLIQEISNKPVEDILIKNIPSQNLISIPIAINEEEIKEINKSIDGFFLDSVNMT
ncbi:hypothetical protein H8356DRAFT_1356579 [Neocallimastix lanati (nom. inval.)]|nr:hypothetical protein H8356DRAFT_1356579 [Neocallimastix sp. JGI-2020a]